MITNAPFIEELLRRVPDLKPIYDEHLTDNDTLLPHVFMGDVVRFAIAEVENPRSRASISTLLEYMEDGLRIGREEVKELIIGSFVENLIGEVKALKVLKPLMGPTLKTQVGRICG